jgi:hypothetical protein
MDLLIFLAIAFGSGALFGMAAYRYALKRNPAKLEEWAKAAKEASRRVEQEIRERT